MKNPEDALISLIRITIGKKSNFNTALSAADWYNLYRLAHKQAILGILFAGIERLSSMQLPPQDILYKWMVVTSAIEDRNEQLNKECVAVQKLFIEAGLKTTILKGQGLSPYYGSLARFRTSGDIDVWVDGDWKTISDFVCTISPNRAFDMKHTHLCLFQDTIVEVHWWPSVSTNPIVNHRLKRFYREHIQSQCCNEVVLPDGRKIFATDPFFDSIHILIHLFDHFLYEGIGLRQVMDYYFVIIHPAVQSRKKEITKIYNEFGLYKFSRAVMWVMSVVFELDSKQMLTEPDHISGKYLWDEIISGGNFGQYAPENYVYKELWFHRMLRRTRRKIRLWRYNPIGVICSPIYKLYLSIWKHMVILKYNL